MRERPECVLAWVQLARLCIANHSFEVAPAATPIDEAIAQAQNGRSPRPVQPAGADGARVRVPAQGRARRRAVETEKAYDLNPDSFVYLEWVGWLFALLGEWDRGTALIRRSIARNPSHIPVALHALWADHLRRWELERGLRGGAAVQRLHLLLAGR